MTEIRKSSIDRQLVLDSDQVESKEDGFYSLTLPLP